MADLLADLRALEKVATPAPWYRAGPGSGRVWRGTPTQVDNTISDGSSQANSALIATMRNALPALLDVAEAAAALLSDPPYHACRGPRCRLCMRAGDKAAQTEASFKADFAAARLRARVDTPVREEAR